MGVAANVASDGALQLYVTQISDPGGKFGSNRGNTYMVSRQDAQGIHFADDAAARGSSTRALERRWSWPDASREGRWQGRTRSNGSVGSARLERAFREAVEEALDRELGLVVRLRDRP